jgi:hypothetical protein
MREAPDLQRVVCPWIVFLKELGAVDFRVPVVIFAGAGKGESRECNPYAESGSVYQGSCSAASPRRNDLAVL